MKEIFTKIITKPIGISIRNSVTVSLWRIVRTNLNDVIWDSVDDSILHSLSFNGDFNTNIITKLNKQFRESRK